MLLSEKKIYEILESVVDPEIPILTIKDIGMLRKVEVSEDRVTVSITPTYSGCPAMKMIEDEIKSALLKEGISQVEIKSILSPAWTTDWMSEEAKLKLEKYGIAPPVKSTVDKKVLMGEERIVRCPLCKSTNTEMKSQFGSTACKALYVCLDCKEPFDYFKCL